MIVSLSSYVLTNLKNTFETGLEHAGECRWSNLCREALRDHNYEFGMYCPICHPWIPRIIAVTWMIQYINRYRLETYDLDHTHRFYKLLKDDLPEVNEAEIDSHFYTFVPKERLPMDPLTLNAIAKFCKIVFENPEVIRWSKWVVESGKHPERPNPHIHACVRFNGSPKNFQRDYIRKEWKKIFPHPDSTFSWKRKVGNKTYKGIDRYPCQTLRITEDKVRYMSNDHKHQFGDDHTNFVDLGINGGLS